MSDGVSDELADLAGKYFHHLEGELLRDRGVVVGLAYHGVYALEFWDVLGEPAYQELLAIEQMISTGESTWRFFDSKEWADRSLPLSQSNEKDGAG